MRRIMSRGGSHARVGPAKKSRSKVRSAVRLASNLNNRKSGQYANLTASGMNFNGMTATITSGIASHSEFSNCQNVGGGGRSRSKLHKRQKAAKYFKEDATPILDSTKLINVAGVQSGGISDMTGAALNLDVGMKQDFTQTLPSTAADFASSQNLSYPIHK